MYDSPVDKKPIVAASYNLGEISSLKLASSWGMSSFISWSLPWKFSEVIPKPQFCKQSSKSSKFFLLLSQGKNSHRRASVKKAVLRNFAKFIEKHLCLFTEHLWTTASTKSSHRLFLFFLFFLVLLLLQLVLKSFCLNLWTLNDL